MKVNIINGNIRVIPFNEEEPFIEITEEELELIHKGELKVKDGELIDNTNELLKEKLRTKREPLLVAFDAYKSNVNYGIEEETPEEKINILTWYSNILNLKEEAINNPPEKIKYYL